VGITNNLTRRLTEHNQGKSKFSSTYKPWIVLYTEVATDYAQARIREKYLKSAAGRRFLFTQQKENTGSLPE
jgi:predicted GIY-YIG superfamily endonuclease